VLSSSARFLSFFSFLRAALAASSSCRTNQRRERETNWTGAST
jgi:hypothetical protein